MQAGIAVEDLIVIKPCRMGDAVNPAHTALLVQRDQHSVLQAITVNCMNCK